MKMPRLVSFLRHVPSVRKSFYAAMSFLTRDSVLFKQKKVIYYYARNEKKEQLA